MNTKEKIELAEDMLQKGQIKSPEHYMEIISEPERKMFLYKDDCGEVHQAWRDKSDNIHVLHFVYVDSSKETVVALKE